MCRTGAGVVASWSTTTGGIGIVTDIDGYGESREAINCPTALNATSGDYQEKEQGFIVDTSPITLNIEFDPDHAQAVAGIPNAAETMTITWPIVAPAAAGATLIGTGFFTERTMGTLSNNEATVGSWVWTWDNKTPPAFTAGV